MTSRELLRLRIAIIGPAHPYKGGAAHHCTEMAHRMAAAGHDVALESWSAQYPKLLYPGRLTVTEPEMPLFHPTRRRLSWRRPDGWLREGRRIGRWADLVVLQYHSTVQVVPYLGILRGLRGTGARSVIIANNVLPHERRTMDERLVRALFRRLDRIVVHTEQQADLARTLTATPVVAVPLPPHLPSRTREASAASPGHAPGSDAAVGATPVGEAPVGDGSVGEAPVGDGSVGEAPVGDGSVGNGVVGNVPVRNRLLFFGLVRPYKGLDVLLRALAEARVDPSLTVAGEFWGGAEQTRRLVRELGLADRVSLREGYVDGEDIPGLFATADALVLPYRSATGSQNTLLAFEHGLPVIATRTGALAEPVTDGVDGIVCRPDDVVDLRRAIERFYGEGEPARLRCNVKRPDATPAWDAYLAALLTLPR